MAFNNKRKFPGQYPTGPRARAAGECVVVSRFEPELKDTAKQVKARESGNCEGCGVVLVAGTAVYWLPTTKKLYCNQCVETNNR